MNRYRLASVVALSMLFTAHFMYATERIIGVAMSNGALSIDKARVPGNATLFEGNNVETAGASSDLKLNTGTHVKLGLQSRGTVHGDHLVLDKGGVEFDAPASYRVEARSLSIASSAPHSSIQVVLKGANTIQVAALTGGAQILNRRGMVVANMAPGRVLEFTPQEAGGSSMNSVVGCVANVGSAYMLRDETSGAIVELRNGNVAAHVGHRIKANGSTVSGTPAEGANQVISVSNVQMLSSGCTSDIPGAVAGATAGASAAGGGGGATGGGAHGIAVVAGIAVAAAVGVTVGVVATEGESVPIQSISPSR